MLDRKAIIIDLNNMPHTLATNLWHFSVIKCVLDTVLGDESTATRETHKSVPAHKSTLFIGPFSYKVVWP